METNRNMIYKIAIPKVLKLKVSLPLYPVLFAHSQMSSVTTYLWRPALDQWWRWQGLICLQEALIWTSVVSYLQLVAVVVVVVMWMTDLMILYLANPYPPYPLLHLSIPPPALWAVHPRWRQVGLPHATVQPRNLPLQYYICRCSITIISLKYVPTWMDNGPEFNGSWI